MRWNRVHCGSVISMCPYWACLIQAWITDPWDIQQFPYRTATKWGYCPAEYLLALSQTRSPTAFVCPYKVLAAQALSEETNAARLTPEPRQALITLMVPVILVPTASTGLYSARGTIFWAAAWIQYSIPLKARLSLSGSSTAPMRELRRL